MNRYSTGDYTIYAACHHCGHVETRPSRAWPEDWRLCECCRRDYPEKYDDYNDAEDAVDQTDDQRRAEGRLPDATPDRETSLQRAMREQRDNAAAFDAAGVVWPR